MADGEWWFDLKTKTAVHDSRSWAKAVDRLGPYATREEAERALDKVAERNEQWENDPDWRDD